MNPSLSRRIAQVAWAIAVAGLLAFVFIILFYTIGQPFGSLNDASIGLGGILSAGFAFVFFPIHRARAPRTSLVGLCMACLGAIIVALGSAFVISGRTGWVLAGWYTCFGNALIGLWFLFLGYALRRENMLPRDWTNFGMIIGVLMTLGVFVLPGLITGTDSMDALPWNLWVGQISYLGSLLLYPVWCAWLGRYLTRKARAVLSGISPVQPTRTGI